MEEEKFESLAKRFRLDGKVAIGTGGSPEFGRAIALVWRRPSGYRAHQSQTA
jgi:hypothetical protein